MERLKLFFLLICFNMNNSLSLKYLTKARFNPINFVSKNKFMGFSSSCLYTSLKNNGRDDNLDKQKQTVEYTTIISGDGFNTSSIFPKLLFQGIVQKGYGRGSKSLGFPTANLPQFQDTINNLKIKTGVYYGFASLSSKNSEDNIVYYPTVANIGRSPTFMGNENSGDIVECLLLDYSGGDFYGEILQVYLIGYIRNEKKFKSLDELKYEIKNDIKIARSRILNDSYVKDIFITSGHSSSEVIIIKE